MSVLKLMFGESRDHVVVFAAGGDVTYRNGVVLEREPPPVVLETARHVIASNTAQSVEWGDRSGSTIRYWYTAEVSPYDGGALCISRDITSLKRTEERLRRSEQMMVDTQGVAHLGTWEWDITQPTATWSAELYRIYGLTPETYTPSYEAYLAMVHPDDRQRVADATTRVFKEHVPYSHDERIMRPDGSLRWLHTWAFPLIDDAGALTHLIGVCQDITDRANAETALNEANVNLEHRILARTHELEVALRGLEGFSSMVTHDLRGPLSVISMVLELIGNDPGVSESVAKYLERGHRAVGAMSRLIEDLLAFARVGQSALSPASVDVSAVAAEIISELRILSPERVVTVTIAPGLQVTADPALFRLALTNLVSNAWKYSGKTTAPEIEVGRDGQRLFVRDNGVGFDMADAAKLFTPFQRLRSSVGFEGTGIGLATVAAVIQRHGGTVSAHAAEGQGATFYVQL